MFGIYFYEKLGNSTENALKIYKDCGFSNLGLYWKSNYFKSVSLTKLAKKMNFNIVAIHAPFKKCGSIWKNNFSGFIFFHLMKKYIKLAKKFGIENIVCHSNDKNEFSPTKVGLKRFKKLVLLCEKYNINLALENIRTIDHVDYLMKNIESPNLRICLDIGHANVYVAKPLVMIEKYNTKISTVHISDNDDVKDLHLIPGQGKIDWKVIIPKLKEIYSGPLMLELDNNKTKDFHYTDLKKYMHDAHSAAEYLDSLN